MNGNILPFAKSEHQRALESLPWFLTGTLAPDESELVDRHVRGCAECSAELASQRVLRQLVVASDLCADPEPALARLHARLQPAPSARRRWHGLERVRVVFRAIPAWAGLALASQLGIILALGWALERAEPAAVSYRALASEAAPAPRQGRLIVVFDPAMPQRDVQRILRAAGARVADGPLASGGYALDVAPERLAQALARLRAEPSVVLAESLQTGATP